MDVASSQQPDREAAVGESRGDTESGEFSFAFASESGNKFDRPARAFGGESDSWNVPLIGLLEKGFIQGFALLSLHGETIEAHGSLCDAFRDIDSLTAQHMFLRPLLDVHDNDGGGTGRAPEPQTSIDFAGVQHQIISKGACRMYAVGPRRVSGLCVDALPFGVLISQHGREVPPQVAVAQLEAVCDKLRQ